MSLIYKGLIKEHQNSVRELWKMISMKTDKVCLEKKSKEKQVKCLWLCMWTQISNKKFYTYVGPYRKESLKKMREHKFNNSLFNIL